MRVIQKSISEIRPYFRNPRINDKTVAALEKSIQRYGFNVPLLIDKDGVIITGHARYKALINLGKQYVEVIIASHLNEEQIREYRIVDNLTQEVTMWETDALKIEIESIDTWELAMDFFDDTLDTVLQMEIPDIDLPDLDISYTDTLSEEERERKAEIEEENDLHFVRSGSTVVVCPYCGEDNDLKDARIEG